MKNTENNIALSFHLFHFPKFTGNKFTIYIVCKEEPLNEIFCSDQTFQIRNKFGNVYRRLILALHNASVQWDIQHSNNKKVITYDITFAIMQWRHRKTLVFVWYGEDITSSYTIELSLCFILLINYIILFDKYFMRSILCN